MYEINDFINYCNEMMIVTEGLRLKALGNAMRKTGDVGIFKFGKELSKNYKDERHKLLKQKELLKRGNEMTPSSTIARDRSELTREEKDVLEKAGDLLATKVVAYLKRYIKENHFDQKYKHSIYSYKTCCRIEKHFVDAYEVQLSNEQYAIDNEKAYKWEHSHPGLSCYDAPEFDTKWYYELQEVGEKSVEQIFNELGYDEKYVYGVHTGDGDEGLLYIELEYKKRKE